MNRLISFFGSSIGLNVLFVLEGLTALLIDTTIASLLGLGVQSDILYAAWNLPNIIGRGVFQSLTASFLGLLDQSQNNEKSADVAVDKGDLRAADLPNEAISLIIVSAAIFTVFLFWTGTWWLPLLTHGLTPDAQQQSIFVSNILIWTLCFLAPIETMRAILYHGGRTIFPSIARLCAAFATVLIMVVLRNQLTLPLLAWAILAGVILEFSLGLLMLHKNGSPFRFKFPSWQITRSILRTAGMPLSGQGIRAVASLVELAIASLFGPGYLTAVSYVRRLINMIERFVFQGFVLATIKNYATQKEIETWRRMHRLVVFLAIPVFVALAFCSTPIVRILFARREFTEQNVLLLGSILGAHTIAVLSIASSRVPLGLTYAEKRGEIVLGYFVIVSVVLLLTEFVLYISMIVPIHLIFGIAYALSIGSASLWLSYHLSKRFQLWRDQQLSKLLLMGAAAYSVAGMFHRYLWPLMQQSLVISAKWGLHWVELTTTTAAGILVAVMIGYSIRQTEIVKVKGYLT